MKQNNRSLCAFLKPLKNLYTNCIDLCIIFKMSCYDCYITIYHIFTCNLNDQGVACVSFIIGLFYLSKASSKFFVHYLLFDAYFFLGSKVVVIDDSEYRNEFTNHLLAHRVEGFCVDFTIFVHESTFQVHKIILASSSKYFKYVYTVHNRH